MKGLHAHRSDATPDQPASPIAAVRQPRLKPLGVVVVFLLMLAIGTFPSAWATPGPDNGTVPTPTPLRQHRPSGRVARQTTSCIHSGANNRVNCVSEMIWVPW